MRDRIVAAPRKLKRPRSRRVGWHRLTGSLRSGSRTKYAGVAAEGSTVVWQRSIARAFWDDRVGHCPAWRGALRATYGPTAGDLWDERAGPWSQRTILSVDGRFASAWLEPSSRLAIARKSSRDTSRPRCRHEDCPAITAGCAVGGMALGPSDDGPFLPVTVSDASRPARLHFLPSISLLAKKPATPNTAETIAVNTTCSSIGLSDSLAICTLCGS